ncbi:hypothetical protein [Enterococcus casseliflavus]|uniref:Uncharacterized protein n=1 Tax=Enterococcus casseliflavus TaxID=37734 RepID=A0ABD6YZS0_ENTCA|nr:hypothetical protein [Enterococcus casseliflavus]QGN29582.1 hypothetical protein GFU50_08690 [Enterococcus casseliflavus]
MTELKINSCLHPLNICEYVLCLVNNAFGQFIIFGLILNYPERKTNHSL